MSEKTYHVLFLCTHNCARSILAEGLLNHLGEGRFKAWSAGSRPRENQQPHPMALEALAKAGIATDGLRSKSWDEFGQPDAPKMDLVITVCDNAAGEVCPLWPGQPITAHWGMPDPAAVEGSEEVRMKAFWNVALTMRRRIDMMRALPLERLERLAIQTEVRTIGAAQ